VKLRRKNSSAWTQRPVGRWGARRASETYDACLAAVRCDVGQQDAAKAYRFTSWRAPLGRGRTDTVRVYWTTFPPPRSPWRRYWTFGGDTFVGKVPRVPSGVPSRRGRTGRVWGERGAQAGRVAVRAKRTIRIIESNGICPIDGTCQSALWNNTALWELRAWRGV